MRNSRVFIYFFIPVILLGLLIFLNPHMPGQFLRLRLLKGMSLVVRPLNSLRVWGNGSVLPQEDNSGQINPDREEKLAAAHVAIEALTQENNRLRSLLGFKDKNNINTKGAGIMYYGREFGKEYMLINRGINEKVQKGDGVINANGLLVGTVKEVEDSFAKVGIASNTEEVFDVELIPSGVKAFAKGLGGRTFSLEIVAQNAAIRRGDYIMMKNDQSSFLLGEVVRVETTGTGTFKEVRAILLAHPDLEKEVFVVSNK